MNFTGIVLPKLNARRGSAKLPPVVLATSPPIGGKKPVKPSGARVTVNEQVALFPDASFVVQTTVVVPTLKPDPLGTEYVTRGAGSMLSLTVGAG